MGMIQVRTVESVVTNTVPTSNVALIHTVAPDGYTDRIEIAPSDNQSGEDALIQFAVSILTKAGVSTLRLDIEHRMIAVPVTTVGWADQPPGEFNVADPTVHLPLAEDVGVVAVFRDADLDYSEDDDFGYSEAVDLLQI